MPQELCPVVVGRDAELAALDEALQASLCGQGGCVVLIGEPGIGKSRLAREVAAMAADRDVHTVIGRAVPAAAAAVAYRPLTEALLQLLRASSVPDDPGLARWLPALDPVIPGISAASHESKERVSPAVRGEALLQLLRRLAPEGLVMILEDLHWADPDSVELTEYLVDNLKGEKLLCVLTLRNRPQSTALATARRLRSRAGIVTLALDRLSEANAQKMAQACRPGADEASLRRVRAAAEGIPLLIEDVLASPGVPESFLETVRERLATFDEGGRTVIEAAAVLGRRFQWELLPAASGQSPAQVDDAIAQAIERQLMETDGTATKFRHALTREAVLDTMLPQKHRSLAAAALGALREASPQLGPGQRELAIDLAVRSGDRKLAGGLLRESGADALHWGALATAVTTLRRSAELLEGCDERPAAELLLVEALALAGRVDEAAAEGGRLITRLGSDPNTSAVRTEAHLRLAQAAVAASRWQMARYQLEQAKGLTGDKLAEGVSERTAVPAEGVGARIAVLDAEVAFAADDLEKARALAEDALNDKDAGADIRCHALEIIGRSQRSRDLPAARAAFERALVTAETADLAVWRLRALHELGTVDMFDHVGSERLSEARRTAEDMGALSTAAILDLQLSACFTCRWDLDRCDSHARAALDIAGQLGLEQVKAKALAMLAGSASHRANLQEVEHWATQTLAAAPQDRMLEGLCGGSRGVALLLGGEGEAALEPWARGMAVLSELPHAEPASMRALWPLVLASASDRRAATAAEETRRNGVDAFYLNRALIGYAEAVLAGRAGQTTRADALISQADRGFTNCGAWADLARLLSAPSALADGWGQPDAWLEGAAGRFTALGLPAMAQRCEALANRAESNPWAADGVSPREADVLRLVVEGLANKEIAARLVVSPRTVEKHVESLLRKFEVRSRTELVAVISMKTGRPGTPRGRRANT